MAKMCTEYKNHEGNTAIHIACCNENTIDFITDVLCNNSNVLNITNDLDQTPLHIAITYDLVNLAKYLINSNASLRTQDKDGNTPLHYAVMQQNKDLTDLIIKKDPWTEQFSNKNNETPFGLAVKQNWNGGKKYFLAKDGIANSTYLLDALNANIGKNTLSGQDKALLKMLLQKTPLIDEKTGKPVRDKAGNSALDLALQISVETVNDILQHTDKKADLINDIHPTTGYSPFAKACKDGNLPLVKLFSAGDKANLEQTVTNKSSVYFGYTPLLLAAAHGHKDTYFFLLHQGCNQKAYGIDGKNLAFILIEQRDKLDKDGTEFDRLIACHPTILATKLADGSNVLHVAMQHNNKDLYTDFIQNKYINYLLIHKQNNNGKSPMHIAIETENIEALTLMKKYGDVLSEIRTQDRLNYLSCALETENPKIITLCATSELVNKNDEKTKMTPLSWVTKHKKNDLMKLLLAKNADPKVKNEDGSTALDLAVMSENKEAFNLLIPRSSSADFGSTLKLAINKDRYYFETLLNKMSQNQKEAFFRQPLKQSSCFLHHAIDCGYLGKIKIALQHGLNLNEPFADGTLPLHYAAHLGFIDLMQLFVESPFTSLHAVDKEGKNALMTAALYGHVKIAQYLLSQNLNPLTKATDGKTILHYAAQSGNTKMLEAVLTMNTDINAKDNNGNTPLLLAGMSGNAAGVRLLVQNKVNVELRNNAGKDIFTILKEQENLAYSWDKQKFQQTRHYLENQKINLSKDRADLMNLFNTIWGLQQQNAQLCVNIKQYAPGTAVVYQPAQLSTCFTNLATLSADQVKEESKKLEEQKKEEERQYSQYLVPLWQQVYAAYYQQMPSMYQNAAPATDATPSAPPMDDTTTGMDPKTFAAYQAELNKQTQNSQSAWNQQPPMGNNAQAQAPVYP